MDLHILDLLELTGSQTRAGEALAMHQSTVSRSLREISSALRLVPRPGARVCRYGTNECLHHLRLAARAHRRLAGVLRIGTDALHQVLLAGMRTVQRVPPRFRTARHWAALVEQALLDGAIVSSWCHDRPVAPGDTPAWEGVVAVELGAVPLELVATSMAPRRVLLPRRTITPSLHEVIVEHGLRVEQQPVACQEPAAWLKRMRDRNLAMPLCIGLLDPLWLAQQGLVRLEEQPPLRERLWLLLPRDRAEVSRLSRHGIRTLRSRVRKGTTQRHGSAEA
jgi:hypothetical protein